jgi:hypothetical protein
LKQPGCEVISRRCGPGLFAELRRDHPDVVFNLASVYGQAPADLAPAILEMAGVAYTGSGLLGLSLAHNYSQLLPLLAGVSLRLPPFVAGTAGECALPPDFAFPLYLYVDGERRAIIAAPPEELAAALSALPASHGVAVLEPPAGRQTNLFLLDRQPFLSTPGGDCLVQARQACELLETRGLVRFDFTAGRRPVLVAIQVAPDPLDADLLYAATAHGWDAGRLLRSLVDHAGSDL